MKLKVCGMRERENIKALEDLKPDYMGFIFWAPSSRYVTKETPSLPAHIKKVGVFVDASLDYIQSVVTSHELQAVQLHGIETTEYCELIQSLGVEVLKAFSIKEDFDFSVLEEYENNCDYFLLILKEHCLGEMGLDLIGIF